MYFCPSKNQTFAEFKDFLAMTFLHGFLNFIWKKFIDFSLLNIDKKILLCYSEIVKMWECIYYQMNRGLFEKFYISYVRFA